MRFRALSRTGGAACTWRHHADNGHGVFINGEQNFMGAKCIYLQIEIYCIMDTIDVYVFMPGVIIPIVISIYVYIVIYVLCVSELVF